MGAKLDINAIRDRLSNLQTQTKKTEGLWKPKPGTSVIRIVPYKFQPENPFIELLFHYDFGGKNYLSPMSFGRPDPIYEFAQKLKASGDKEKFQRGKKLEPKMRTYVPIIVRGEEEKGVKFWSFGKQVYQDILMIIADSDYGDITDPKEGFDLTIDYKTAEESGKNFPTTTIRPKRNPSPITTDMDIMKKVAQEQKNLLEIYKELSYEELNEVLQKYLNGEEPSTDSSKSNDDEVEEEVEEVKPTKTTKASNEKSGMKATSLDDVENSFDALFNNK